ncbi:MAG: hypothetical protein WBC21_02100 [Minisyncoccales bacterium]
MKRAAHGWIALRAFKLIDDISVKGKIGNVYHTDKLIELLSYYLSNVWDGAWIPDSLICDMKYGHIFKQTNDPKILGSKSKDKRSRAPYKELKSRLKGKRLCLERLKEEVVLNEHYWSKEGYLPNRVIALTHSVGDMLKLGDFPLAFYLRERRRKAYEGDLSAASIKSLSLSPTFSARQIATTLFMLSHYITDAYMPLHCDYRDYTRAKRVRPIPPRLHPSIEEEWEKSFPKESIVEIGKYSKNSVDNIVLNLPKSSIIKIDKEERYKLSASDKGLKRSNNDVWQEMVNVCRVSYGLSLAWINKEDAENKKSGYEDVRDLIRRKGKEEFIDITNLIFHDAVESVARIWLLIWGKFTERPKILYIGNNDKNHMEVHQHTCPWLELVKSINKVKFINLIDAHKQGFDNCAHCLGGSKR